MASATAQDLQEYLVQLVKNGWCYWYNSSHHVKDPEYATKLFTALYKYVRDQLAKARGRVIAIRPRRVVQLAYGHVAPGYGVFVLRILDKLLVLAEIHVEKHRKSRGTVVLVNREDAYKLLKVMREIAEKAGLKLEE